MSHRPDDECIECGGDVAHDDCEPETCDGHVCARCADADDEADRAYDAWRDSEDA